MLYIANVFTGSGGHFIQSLCAQAICQDWSAEFDYDDVAHSHNYMDQYRAENFINYQFTEPQHWSSLECKTTDSNGGNWIIEASTEEDYAEISKRFGKWRRIFILVHHDYLLWQASNHMIKNRILQGQDRTLERVQEFLDQSALDFTQYEAYRNHLNLERIYGASWTLTFRDIFLDPIVVINLLEDFVSRPILVPGLMNYRKYLQDNLKIIQDHMPWLIDRYNVVTGINKAINDLEQLIISRLSC